MSWGPTPTTCASHPLDARRCLRRPSARRPFLQGAPHDLCLTSFGCSAVFAAPFCSTTVSAGSTSRPVPRILRCSAVFAAPFCSTIRLCSGHPAARRVMRGMRKAALAGYRACVDGGQAPSHAREKTRAGHSRGKTESGTRRSQASVDVVEAGEVVAAA